jgi:hypothetical protein
MWERVYPLWIGLGVAFAYLLMPTLRDFKIPESFNGVLGAVIGLAVIAAGFLATAKSIIISPDDRDIIRKLKKTPYYRAIVADLGAAVFNSCLLAVYSTAGLMVDLKEPWTFLREILFAVWIGLTMTTMLAYYRAMASYSEILRAEDF